MATGSPDFGDLASPVDEVATLASSVVTHLTAAQKRLSRLGGGRPSAGAPHLWQLNRVISTALGQAEHLAQGPLPARANSDLDLWRLREPGYLRNIADHPVARPNGVLVLVPVALTWLFLGWAELNYTRAYTGTPAGARPPFFADWISAPLYRGPVALAAMIVLSVVVIMYVYGRVKRDQNRADALDVAMQALEAQLYEPLTALRDLVATPQSDAQISRAAEALFQASFRIGQAADQLVESVPVTDRLGSIIDRLIAALPQLEKQTAQLSEIDARLRETAVKVAEDTRPVVELMTRTADAANAATEAVTKSEAAMIKASEQIAAAHRLGERTAESHRTLADAQRPFVDAAGTVAKAAQQLCQTSELLTQTVDGVRQTVDKVNWLALVADGLRNGDAHRPPFRS